MLINRNNYETFFLLYADDELCAEERTAVENFVAENEDLRGELNLTLASVLPADDFSFDLKDSLYKNSFVDGTLQEKLLLKIDNELSAKEVNELDKSIASNPSALKEEELLSAAKLDATEIISFPKKELLYKKERDAVVVFRMVRWAAAAILIGFGLFFGWSLYSKKAIPNTEVAAKPITRPSSDETANSQIRKDQIVDTNTLETPDKENSKSTNTAAATVKENKTLPEDQTLDKKKDAGNAQELATNIEVQKTTQPIDKISVPAANDLQNIVTAKIEKVDVAAIINENIVPMESSYTLASLTETEVSNNKILYMDEDDVKRSKVGTVFKKFKRMIERTAKIKTGNPIRISGFQIGAD